MYDNTGNVLYEGKHFNTQTFAKMYLFVICMISRHLFQTKITSRYCLILEILGQNCHVLTIKMYNQPNTKQYMKHPPMYKEAAVIRDVFLYKKLTVQVSLY